MKDKTDIYIGYLQLKKNNTSILFCAFTCTLLIIAAHSKTFAQSISSGKLLQLATDDTTSVNKLLQRAKLLEDKSIHLDTILMLQDQAYAISNRIQYTEGKFTAVFRQGVVTYYKLEDRTRGARLYQESLKIAKEANDPKMLSKINYALATLYSHLHNYTESIRHFLDALNYANKTTEDELKMKAMTGLIDTNLTLGNKTEAMKYSSDMMALINRTQQAYIKASGLFFMTFIYDEAEQDLKKAIRAQKQVLDIFSTIPDLSAYDWARSQIRYAELLDKEGGHHEQMEQIIKSLEKDLESGDISIQMIAIYAYHLFSIHYSKRSDYEKAWIYKKKAAAINDEHAANITRSELEKVQAQFNTENKEKTIELLNKERQLQEETILLRNQQLLLSLITLLLFGILLFYLVKFFKHRNKAFRIIIQQKEKLQVQKEEMQAQRDHLEKLNKEINELNNNLDDKVKLKTLELQQRNLKLIEYSFINAHKLRGPLARVLGLLYLFHYQPALPTYLNDLISKLETEAKKLDDVVHEINKVIES